MLLHTSGGTEDDWRLWLTAAGLPTQISKHPGVTFDLSFMTVQAAIDGIGVAIGRTSYVEADIAKGRLVVPFKITLPADAGFYLVSPEGKMVTYTGVTAAGWFGEGSLLKSELRRYDGVALRDTRMAAMPRQTFHWLLSNSIPFNRFILDQLNERLAQMIALVDSDRMRDPEARVAQCLASLYNPQLYPGTDSHLQISQEEIGHLSGLSRQRVNHALHVLQEAELLRVEHVGITIRDLHGMRAW